MSKTGTAKLFRNGRSQAVRLPKEFRFEGDRVRVRRVPEGVLLAPMNYGPQRVVSGDGPQAGRPISEGGKKTAQDSKAAHFRLTLRNGLSSRYQCLHCAKQIRACLGSRRIAEGS